MKIFSAKGCVIIKYLILSLFVLIFILLFIPVKIQLYYEFLSKSKYKVTISYLFGIIKKEIDSSEKEKKSNFKIDGIDFVKYFIERSHIEKLYLNINLGIDDPGILGISIGIVWAIVNGILAYLLRNKNIDKIDHREINVVPKFNEDIFELIFICIIKVNLVYIITAYIRILKRRKVGECIAGTSN